MKDTKKIFQNSAKGKPKKTGAASISVFEICRMLRVHQIFKTNYPEAEGKDSFIRDESRA